MITSVEVNFGIGRIYIKGKNFGADAPAVTLSGQSLTLNTSTAESIDAVLPAGTQPGSCLLEVSCRPSTTHNDLFDLTLGAVGPQGPHGVPGPKRYGACRASALPRMPDTSACERRRRARRGAKPLPDSDSRRSRACQARASPGAPRAQSRARSFPRGRRAARTHAARLQSPGHPCAARRCSSRVERARTNSSSLPTILSPAFINSLDDDQRAFRFRGRRRPSLDTSRRRP